MDDLFPFAVAMLLLFGVAVGIGSCADNLTCNAHWQGVQHRWSLFGDCQVMVNGHWVPEDNLRVVRS